MSNRQPPHERTRTASGQRPVRRTRPETDKIPKARERTYLPEGQSSSRRQEGYASRYPPRHQHDPRSEWPERPPSYQQRLAESWDEEADDYYEDEWSPSPPFRERYGGANRAPAEYDEPLRQSSQARRQPPPKQRAVQPMKKKPSRARHVFLIVYNLFFYIVTIGILMGALLFAFSEKTTASILGYRFYSVLTNSMVPQEDSLPGGFYAGDIAIVKMMDGAEAEVGDILTFQVGSKGNYLTHRLVEKREELNGEAGNYLITQGDANDSPDPPIEADRVIGKVVFAIPELGNVIAFVRDNLVMCLISVGSTFGLIIVLKAYFMAEEEPSLQTDPSRNHPRNTPRRRAA